MYEFEAAELLKVIGLALKAGRTDEQIALEQQCSPQDIAAIRAGLRAGRSAGPTTIAQGIYGLRVERRQGLASALRR